MAVELRLNPANRRPTEEIFFDPAHARLAHPDALHIEAWEDEFLASIVVAEHDTGHWVSPVSATFGGYLFDRTHVHEFQKVDDAVRAELAGREGQSIEIWLPPLAHDEPRLSALLYEMTAAGYALLRTDLSYVRRLGTDPLNGFSRGNLRRLAKCTAAGVRARKVPIDALANVYAVIAANREAKGFPLSMSIDRVKALAAAFPERIHLFETTKDGEAIAAGLCLDIDRQALQVVYWGDLPGFGHLSPIVPLAEAILRAATESGFEFVDVGTSTIGAEPNRGLMHFKSGLGFLPSAKLRLRRDLRSE